MRSFLCTVFVLSLYCPPCLAQTKTKTPAPQVKGTDETSHLAFVTEHIRELSAVENIRSAADCELKQDTTSNAKFSTTIHSSELFQLELASQIHTLQGMHLNPPFDSLIPDVTAFYKEKITLWKRLSDISSTLLEGPKPGVDYGKLLAEVPKIRARLDYIDQALFQATPEVFATLIDMKADSKGHASHLVITRAERQRLIGDLNTDFGSKLDQKNEDYTVSGANVLRAYLLKGFKCSDEPWE